MDVVKSRGGNHMVMKGRRNQKKKRSRWGKGMVLYSDTLDYKGMGKRVQIKVEQNKRR